MSLSTCTVALGSCLALQVGLGVACQVRLHLLFGCADEMKKQVWMQVSTLLLRHDRVEGFVSCFYFLSLSLSQNILKQIYKKNNVLQTYKEKRCSIHEYYFIPSGLCKCERLQDIVVVSGVKDGNLPTLR